MEYWNSANDPEFLRTRQDELDAMIRFLNFDIQHATEGHFFQDIVSDYVRFTVKDSSQHHFQTFVRDHYRMAGDITPGAGPEHIQEKKEAFMHLQRHIIQRVESIMKAMESGKPDTLFYIERPFSLHIRPSENRFIGLFDEDFQTDFVLEEEKERLDLRLIAIIGDLNLKPGRFRKCEKCGDFFYQPTSRDKNYCSRKCAASIRQTRYLKRKSDKGKEEKRRLRRGDQNEVSSF